MKKLFVSLALCAIITLSSCGVNYATIGNHNLNNTQVHLSTNNFKVVDKVAGTAYVQYIVFIGGLKKQQLYEKAYSDMLAKANLLNTSKALVNILTEEHYVFITPYYIRRTLTVSANVIEFTR
ncbi:hypothetical protein CNR22_01820 [Sphingobacteriaceae bacterium]|nr:hypothetical protein CNR22_01820 [Sphingobacteriaceae bacterium]